MKIAPLSLPGAQLITLPAFTDMRGIFVKTYHHSSLWEAGLDFQLKESYYSLSKKGVIRGMHFQTPPHEHSKIVFCPVGAILDVIIDLRKNSPSYGQYHAEILSQDNNQAYYIPAGFAHGFKALTEDAMTYYLVSSEYNASSDTGIRWDSFGYNWDCPEPIISQRDQSFSVFADFSSPF